MHRLQIFHSQRPEVLLCCENRAMAENPPQEFQIPAPPQVLARKRMAAGMGRHADAGNAGQVSQRFEGALEIPYRQLGIPSRSKHQGC